MTTTAHIHILFKRQGGLCGYCERPMTLDGRRRKRPAPNVATIDHMVPIWAGGSSAIENKIACCYACNQLKGPPHAVVYRVLLRTGNIALIERKRDDLQHRLVDARQVDGYRADRRDFQPPVYDRTEPFWPYVDRGSVSTLADVWPEGASA